MKETILKVAKEKEIIKAGPSERITAEFSTKSLRVKRVWNNVFQDLKDNCHPDYYT